MVVVKKAKKKKATADKDSTSSTTNGNTNATAASALSPSYGTTTSSNNNANNKLLSNRFDDDDLDGNSNHLLFQNTNTKINGHAAMNGAGSVASSKSGKSGKIGKSNKKKKKKIGSSITDDSESSINMFEEEKEQQRTQQKANANNPQPTVEPPQSLAELLKLCELSKQEQWLQTQKITASIRLHKLGLPIRKNNVKNATTTTTDDKKFVEQMKNVFVDIIADIHNNGEDADILEPLYDCSLNQEPNGAFVLLQYLYFCDLDSSTNEEMKVVADLIAKNLCLGTWCREMIHNCINKPFQVEGEDKIIEYCLAFLEKFIFIIDIQERLDYVLQCIFRNNPNPVDGLNELRQDSIQLVTRQINNASSCMTVTRALYLHNSVEIMLFGKNDENPMLDEQVDIFEQCLEVSRHNFPSDKYFQNSLDQLSPCCSYSLCFKRGSFPCCDLASYCCQKCRDDDWRRHRKECENGIDNKVEISFAVDTEELEETYDAASASTMNVNETFHPKASPEEPQPADSSGSNSVEGEMTKEAISQQQTINSENEALSKQNKLLESHPGIDYFLVQSWGNLALQFNAPTNQEFHDLRSTAMSSGDAVKSMCKILMKCCPNLKEEIQLQLSDEYSEILRAGR